MTTFAPVQTKAHNRTTHHASSSPQRGLTTTVPKEYVHRAVVTEVFLTGWESTDADTITVTAQWPRAHTFYGPSAGFHDPLLFMETLRQTVPLLSHAVYGSPMDHRQIWEELSVAIEPEAMRLHPTAAALELHIRCSDIERRAGVVRRVRMAVTAVRDGRTLATATTSFTSHSRALYQRLRGSYADAERAMTNAVALPMPLRPDLVGRDRHHDVVLAADEGGNRWQLRVDVLHPIIFDHPADHAPGMLLLEAARQAAQRVHGPTPVLVTGLEAAFHQYVELDTPAWVTATRTEGDDRVLVTVEQLGAVMFDCAVTVQATP